MEEEDWAWADEDIRLDGKSPLVISLSLWDDFAPNDSVVRSLFPPTPTPSDLVKPAFPFAEPDSLECNSSRDIVSDCSPPPVKRRCCGEDAMENKGCSLVDGVENLESTGLSSPTAMCFMVTDKFSRSIDDVEELSADEGWMAGCIGESDPGDVQEIRTPHCAHTPIDTPVMSAKASGTMASRSRRAYKKAPARMISKQSTEDPGTVQTKVQADKKQVCVNEISIKKAHDRKTGPTNHDRESTPPVLAYPFELLKPSGIQGDVTLQDINHRINMVPSAPWVCSNNDSRKVYASPTILGKSVVALTTIQTEGKGTITIMRTRS